MNKTIAHFYREASKGGEVEGHFHKVLPLHHAPALEWDDVARMVPELPKGWFELARLPNDDRIEFTRDFWLSRLPFREQFSEYLPTFFKRVSEIEIFITQRTFDAPFLVEMVYALQGDAGFFRGRPPATPEQISLLTKHFSRFILPQDYLKFLTVHNGFSKATDTGICSSHSMVDAYGALQGLLAGLQPLSSASGELIEASHLIPFYESFGRHNYQCFFADWYPEQEMGNVYYSIKEHMLVDFHDPELGVENLAFPTFLDWLHFYLKALDEV